ncbi:hypothetical protein C5C44_09030 [Rathayibacter sp. AY1F6]|nr:hypothetical protein C5C44_09030 [Rathayibacter sp. AY1F6]
MGRDAQRQEKTRERRRESSRGETGGRSSGTDGGHFVAGRDEQDASAAGNDDGILVLIETDRCCAGVLLGVEPRSAHASAVIGSGHGRGQAPVVGRSGGECLAGGRSCLDGELLGADDEPCHGFPGRFRSPFRTSRIARVVSGSGR